MCWKHSGYINTEASSHNVKKQRWVTADKVRLHRWPSNHNMMKTQTAVQIGERWAGLRGGDQHRTRSTGTNICINNIQLVYSCSQPKHAQFITVYRMLRKVLQIRASEGFEESSLHIMCLDWTRAETNDYFHYRFICCLFLWLIN